MPTKLAMITDVENIGPDADVAHALQKLMEKRVRAMPVLDDDGKYLGIFSFRQILKAVLPVSATVEGGLDDLSFLYDSHDAMVKKLDEVEALKVRDIMDTKRPEVTEDTVFWETLLLIYKFDSPLPVIDKETGKLVGIVTKQSAIDYLQEEFLGNRSK